MHTQVVLLIVAIVLSVVSITISILNHWYARRALKRAERSYRAANDLRHSLSREAWKWPHIH